MFVLILVGGGGGVWRSDIAHVIQSAEAKSHKRQKSVGANDHRGGGGGGGGRWTGGQKAYGAKVQVGKRQGANVFGAKDQNNQHHA